MTLIPDTENQRLYQIAVYLVLGRPTICVKNLAVSLPANSQPIFATHGSSLLTRGTESLLRPRTRPDPPGRLNRTHNLTLETSLQDHLPLTLRAWTGKVDLHCICTSARPSVPHQMGLTR